LSVCWVYDRMGTDGKPAADQGHDVSSCETTVVFPVHKVLSVMPLFVYCETFNVISFFFLFSFLFERQCYLILCALKCSNIWMNLMSVHIFSTSL